MELNYLCSTEMKKINGTCINNSIFSAQLLMKHPFTTTQTEVGRSKKDSTIDYTQQKER